MIKTRYKDVNGKEHTITTLQTAKGFNAIFDNDKDNKEVVESLTEDEYHYQIRILITEQGGELIT